MLSGYCTYQGMYLPMCNFDYNSVVFLVKTLNKLYGFSLTLHSCLCPYPLGMGPQGKASSKGKINEGIIKIYIGKKDLLFLKNIVKNYIIPEMEYKFNTMPAGLGTNSNFIAPPLGGGAGQREKRKIMFNHGNKLNNQSVRYTHSIAGNGSENKEVFTYNDI